MSNNTALGLLLLLAIVAIGIGLAAKEGFGRPQGLRTITNEVEQSTIDPSRFVWIFESAGENSAGIPLTAVTLRADGVIRDVGTYEGNCFAIEDSSWPYLSNEISGAICWFAGGGAEVGVFREGSGLVVKKGVLDEGSAEIPGMRGDFETILELQ